MLAEVAMATLEERVAYLEGQVSEHSHTLIEIRDSVRHLEQRFDARFEQLERRFEQLERRFEQLEGRCDTRFDQLERRFETRFDVSDRRFEALDDKVARHFTWLVGIQVTTLAAIVGALLARA
jgi:predicted  nucleic acid-binding Zn-ribbon protein